MMRADQLEGCTENSEEARELAMIARGAKPASASVSQTTRYQRERVMRSARAARAVETNMQRKTAIGVMAIAVVAMPAAIFALATLLMRPNSTFEELLFEAFDSRMIMKGRATSIECRGLWQHAASFVGVIKRRYRPGLKTRDDGGGRDRAALDWRSSYH